MFPGPFLFLNSRRQIPRPVDTILFNDEDEVLRVYPDLT